MVRINRVGSSRRVKLPSPKGSRKTSGNRFVAGGGGVRRRPTAPVAPVGQATPFLMSSSTLKKIEDPAVSFSDGAVEVVDESVFANGAMAVVPLDIPLPEDMPDNTIYNKIVAMTKPSGETVDTLVQLLVKFDITPANMGLEGEVLYYIDAINGDAPFTREQALLGLEERMAPWLDAGVTGYSVIGWITGTDSLNYNGPGTYTFKYEPHVYPKIWSSVVVSDNVLEVSSASNPSIVFHADHKGFDTSPASLTEEIIVGVPSYQMFPTFNSPSEINWNVTNESFSPTGAKVLAVELSDGKSFLIVPGEFAFDAVPVLQDILNDNAGATIVRRLWYSIYRFSQNLEEATFTV